MNDRLQSSYDAFPYQSFPFAQTHPDRLATLGQLFGATPPPIATCRVLEIGCASGGNLIPMAASMPRAQFVGVDFSPVQIAEGDADVRALGLANIRLLDLDIRAFGDAFGRFDYIVAHGVYSWVPDPVQERLLEICERHLAPTGIAYISYNTLPGWRMRGMVREAMQFHATQVADPRLRVAEARAMLDFLAQSLRADPSAYASALREEAERVRHQADYYVFHEYLEEVNDPVYFHQFMERVSRHGLRYLADTDFASMLSSDLAPEVKETLARIAPDVLKREQFMDFLRNRTFRQTLLVREAVSLNRKLSPLPVMSLHVASQARPERTAFDLESDASESFLVPDGPGLKTAQPVTKAAMLALAAIWPASLSFDALCDEASARLGGATPIGPEERQRLAFELLQAFAGGVLELHSGPPAFDVVPAERPQASALARLQAARGAQVTNLRHQPGALDDAARRLIALLDGEHSRDAIARSLWPEAPVGEALARLELALSQLARQALLIRDAG